jgi:hypothetical protein
MDRLKPLHHLYAGARGLDTVYAGAAVSWVHREFRSAPAWRVEMDIVFIGALVAFFVLSFGLIRFCERLSDGERR